jgi:hypothetical protein
MRPWPQTKSYRRPLESNTPAVRLFSSPVILQFLEWFPYVSTGWGCFIGKEINFSICLCQLISERKSIDCMPKRVERRKSQRSFPFTREKRKADCKKDLQTGGTGRDSRIRPTRVVGKKPDGKCQLINRVPACHISGYDCHENQTHPHPRVGFGRPSY